jgi:hypothetical protein
VFKPIVIVVVLAVAFIAFIDRRGGDRDAFAECVEKRGAVVGDSSEFADLYAGMGAYEGIAKELDERSVSIRTPDSEGLALVTGSDSDARDAQRAFDEFLAGYTTQRAGNVVVAWSLGPEPSASSAVTACAQ